MTRRELLTTGLMLASGVYARPTDAVLARLGAQAACPDTPAGELLETVPFLGDRRFNTPLGEVVGGRGLDARLFTDLSQLTRDRLITPASQVFIRTTAPAALPAQRDTWTIALDGHAASQITIRDLQNHARPMGHHLIECSGNNDPANFGLMSVAEWDGVPLGDVIGKIKAPASAATSVLVKGFDEHSELTVSSVPGASWVFPIELLHEDHAPFLAVRMNGEPLTRDHGSPVRLVAPGWYGCTWIKWVDEIRFVGQDEPATSQMREFAIRTHQNGVPDLARDYEPPVIDLAATPVRVEKRRVGDHLEYRIVGIIWGGERPVDELMIRFGPTDTPKPLRICPAPKTHRTWSLWEYRWRPPAPGLYTIALKAADPTIRTRRLDLSFYARRVRIDDV